MSKGLSVISVGITRFYGVDADGDAITMLDCGHPIGYPVTALKAAEKAGAGVELRCTPHGVKTWIAAEHIPGLVKAVGNLPAL